MKYLYKYILLLSISFYCSQKSSASETEEDEREPSSLAATFNEIHDFFVQKEEEYCAKNKKYILKPYLSVCEAIDEEAKLQQMLETISALQEKLKQERALSSQEGFGGKMMSHQSLDNREERDKELIDEFSRLKEILQESSSITHFDLSHIKLKDTQFLTIITYLMDHNELKSLNLQGSDINDRSAECLIQMIKARKQPLTINMQDTNIKDDMREKIMNALKALDINRTKDSTPPWVIE